MTVYCIAQAKNIDKDAIARYREHAPTALKKHGGSLVISTTNLIALDGTTDANDSVALLSFPSEEAAIAWREDQELAQVHALRHASADWTIQLLGTM